MMSLAVLAQSLLACCIACHQRQAYAWPLQGVYTRTVLAVVGGECFLKVTLGSLGSSSNLVALLRKA